MTLHNKRWLVLVVIGTLEDLLLLFSVDSSSCTNGKTLFQAVYVVWYFCLKKEQLEGE